ncbi:MAG: hypothetical protein NE330_23835, partial [Lentisphaeraceae bacterium]|nr:hypothetical protein [Lentisphaeraceae bacterium]
ILSRPPAFSQRAGPIREYSIMAVIEQSTEIEKFSRESKQTNGWTSAHRILASQARKYVVRLGCWRKFKERVC